VLHLAQLVEAQVQDLWVKVERAKLEAVEPLFLKVLLMVDQKRWMEAEEDLFP